MSKLRFTWRDGSVSRTKESQGPDLPESNVIVKARSAKTSSVWKRLICMEEAMCCLACERLLRLKFK
jgi:hypothetical protein